MSSPSNRLSGEGRSFDRIIPDAAPRLEDFLSHAELGLPPLRELIPAQERRWAGLSMFDSHSNALAHHGRSRQLGRFIAEVRLSSDDSYVAERTGRSEGHWTVWAPGNLLLDSIVAIIPIEE